MLSPKSKLFVLAILVAFAVTYVLYLIDIPLSLGYYFRALLFVVIAITLYVSFTRISKSPAEP